MHWNRGGWLGGQIGGSCWMLVAGLLSIPSDPKAAITVLMLFAMANLAGWLIWRRRESLSPYKGLQMLVPILGATGIAAVYVLDSAGIYESIQIGASVTAWETYAILGVVVVVLMIMFWLQDRKN
jgi:hypothetical protein